jgi:hypothetical protein
MTIGAPSHFDSLIAGVEEATADSRYEQRKESWTRHNRLEKVAKVPVNVHLHAGYPPIWQELLPESEIVSQEALERSIEIQLRQKLFRHEHIPDDHVLLPTIWINPVRPAANSSADSGPQSFNIESTDGRGEARLWGLPFLRENSGATGGAYRVDPVIRSEDDLSGLHHPRYEVDASATVELCERANALVGGRLPVKVATDEVKGSPSEVMIAFMGIEEVMIDLIDRPNLIHRLMDFITDGSIAYQLEREAAGAVEAEETWSFRSNYEVLPEDADPHRLKNSWAYVSAQSLSLISPGMYEEFLQPYHARLTENYGHGRVYYHGCEDLTLKIPIIRRLPNLRRFHVSAWTDLEAAVAQLQRDFVLETCVHTPNTMLIETPDEWRTALKRIMSIAGDAIIDINITDIETVAGEPSKLTQWSQIAQEVTAGG